MTDFDRDLEATLRGRLAGGTLNIINDALDKLSQQIESRILYLLSQGQPLSAEVAQQAWYQKHAINELRLKLNRIASMGLSAARRIEPKMEIGNAS